MKFIEVKSELGAGKKGSSLGIDALKIVALESNDSIFKNNKSEKISVENNLLLEDKKTPNAKNIIGIYKIYEQVAKAVVNCYKNAETPILLSSDHSIAGGTMAGVKMAHPEKKVGVIWIDAHTDLHSPYTSPSGNVHGMPLATALNLDNIENKVNDISSETAEAWANMKKIGGIYPKVLAEDVVFVGARDIDPEEQALLGSKKIKNYTVKEIRILGMKNVLNEINNRLEKCDIFYVSFDVDSLDPSLSEGTGTPVPDGLFEDEMKVLLNGLLNNTKLACFEITEINPLLDSKNKMAKLVFNFFKYAVGIIKDKKLAV
jgi:arginase